jgi:cell division protein FtsX
MSRSKKEVQRQITLPMSKAIEIAWKSIRLRLSRSLVVTSGIVLAMAFLMYILCGDSTMRAMLQWTATASSSQEYRQAEREAARLQGEVQALAQQLAGEVAGLTVAKATFDARAALGRELPEIQKELGSLPVAPETMKKLLTAKPQLVGVMKQWMEKTRQLREQRAVLNAPQELLAEMKGNGVPTTEAEVQNARVQTRWLIGLALLVAFVGILNAMLMSVTERFREIGTMKCLGALDGFIVKLFLIESFFQGGAGTLIGVILGLLLTVGGASLQYGTYAWKNFPAGEVVLAALWCLGVGIVLTVAGACYPAWRAARMHPIEAMRVEA